ncbi:MAG TPA: phospholipase D-like domain-containing protein [Chloroflexia bacterium]|nr:phospholipase D-like domain-containing protein [Chloroflexia bacterium]
MQVQVIDNTSRKLAAILPPAIEQSSDVRIAVAFMSRTGLKLLDTSIQVALQAGAYLEFLVGLDMQTTEPAALMDIYNLSLANEHVSLYCYSGLEGVPVYHPKLYLLRAGDEVTSVIGSSNLTAGGLKTNIEINALIHGNILDDAISDSYSSYYRLKFKLKRASPDEEYLSRYSEACKRNKQRQEASGKDSSYREAVQRFRKKAESLQQPVPTSRDIVGWPKLAYDALPMGPFTNEQVYQYEQLFQAQYPTNKHVKAKIRQQLQILRDLGLIKHLEEGLWQKMS